jgi:pimeloyl-ACP methyl ester carboxylesterase
MRRSLKILLAFLSLLVIAAVYVLNPRLPEPIGELSADLYQTGHLGISSESLSLTDDTRSTMANGDFPGQPFRELNGRLWYPENRDQGPYPLIIYSHGFMSSVNEADYLIEFLVPKGYVVAAVNYPLSNGSAPGGPTVNDVLNQPGDLSFVLDELLVRNTAPDDSLSGLIDPARLAAVGLSLGGLTSQLAAFHRDERDERLAAAISMAGPAVFLTREFFSTSDIPFMMIAGTEDAIIPFEAHAAPIPEKSDQAILVTLQGATHVGFAGMSSTFMRWFNNPDQMVCPMLLQGLENGDAPVEEMLVPDAAIGISSEQAEPCTMTDYNRAMRPAEQQMLTKLASYAFLESIFADDAEQQMLMHNYLTGTLPGEYASLAVARD